MMQPLHDKQVRDVLERCRYSLRWHLYCEAGEQHGRPDTDTALLADVIERLLRGEPLERVAGATNTGKGY